MGSAPYLLLALHVVFGLLLYRNSLASTAHALLTLGVGLLFVLQSRQRPERVAYIAAYIIGAEVLWRMTGAKVPWEFGKYATSGLFLATMIISGRHKVPKLPLLFFALLLPSVALTIMESRSAETIRTHLSFYMSGPFALMISACFFLNLTLSREQLRKLFFAILCGALSIATITLFATLSASRLVFTSESNFATSGGFGPNQVSGALGMGALMAFLYIIHSKAKSVLTFVVLIVMVVLMVQSALTFSRGGLYNAVGGAAFACFFLMRDRGARSKFVAIAVLLLVLGRFAVVPTLDSFTGGAFSVRFGDAGLAHRDELMRSDLMVWQENPILGVGPGMLAENRAMPHTEFTRLVAEHGIFGLLAILTLFAAAFNILRNRKTTIAKGFSAATLGWSLLFMLDKAMRIAAPAGIFGLAFVNLSSDQDTPRRAITKRSRAAGIRHGSRWRRGVGPRGGASQR